MKPLVILAMLLALAPLLCSQQHREGPKKKPIEINSASVEELMQLPGVGGARAAWIVATRSANGPFRCVEELNAMPRLSHKQFRALRLVAFVEEQDPRCPNSLDRRQR